jgi:broad specificity phosphatase PhoE
MSELKERHHRDNVLIVGHGGALRAAFVALMQLPLEANWRFIMANCGLSVVDVFPDNAVLRLFNDTCHLDELRPELHDQQVAGTPGQPVGI